MEAFSHYLRSRDRRQLKKFLLYCGIIFLFGLGAGLAGYWISYFKAHTIWLSCLLLLVSFCLMFFKNQTIPSR